MIYQSIELDSWKLTDTKTGVVSKTSSRILDENFRFDYLHNSEVVGCMILEDRMKRICLKSDGHAYIEELLRE